MKFLNNIDTNPTLKQLISSDNALPPLKGSQPSSDLVQDFLSQRYTPPLSKSSLAGKLMSQRNNPFTIPTKSSLAQEVMRHNFNPQKNSRHKVFASYYHKDDQYWRERFERLFSDIHKIIVSKSVEIGDIDDTKLSTERIRQIIREDYLQDSTVTVVLIGPNTWKRKYVDWEIGSSIRETKNNSRSGLLGILLPTYRPLNPFSNYDFYTIPPRLHYNIECKFATIHNWSDNPLEVKGWIHQAFKRRNKVMPNNSYPSFKNNRSSERWYE